MKTSIVVGLQYGDEGKGATVSFLSSPDKDNEDYSGKTLVIRYNGGHQAGHTAYSWPDGEHRHIFSNFGSGTLNGAHTYWSQYCTFNPESFFREGRALKNIGYHPIHILHPMSMVTTPFDIMTNRSQESRNKHGSVGVGIGTTMERNEKSPYKLYAVDLQLTDMMVHKLKNIAVYHNLIYPSGYIADEIEKFVELVKDLDLNILRLSADRVCEQYNHVILEGAQGTMLDRDFGYFPNVTRGYTTCRNAMELVKELVLDNITMFYCMRPYLTRHGYGYMPNEREYFQYEDDTNKDHPYQGKFRQGFHSSEQLRYALNCNRIYSGVQLEHLSLTCMEQTNGMILMDNGEFTLQQFMNKVHTFPKTLINKQYDLSKSNSR